MPHDSDAARRHSHGDFRSGVDLVDFLKYLPDAPGEPTLPIMVPPTLYKRARKLVQHDAAKLAEFERWYRPTQPIPTT